MSHTRKILVIDDHFETLALMRALLEGLLEGCRVQTVPSGEEGMLELRQVGYDLLITDVRLPGMSGLELVRRVRRVQPNLPVIVLTGYGSVAWEEEARSLGVQGYLMKPVDGEVLLTAVYAALTQQPESNTPVTPSPVAAASLKDSPLRQRLAMLRTETGAMGLLLVQMDGQVVAQVGESVGVDWERVVVPLAQMMRGSVQLAEAVASEEAVTLQHHDLTPCTLTSATVGRDHFLALFFEPESRRSRVGTVWLFVQRAIVDLLQLLEGVVAEVVPVPELAGEVALLGDVVEATPTEPALDVAGLGALLGLSLDETAVPDDLDSFWSQAVQETEVKKEGLTLAEAQKRGIIPSGLAFGDEPKK